MGVGKRVARLFDSSDTGALLATVYRGKELPPLRITKHHKSVEVRGETYLPVAFNIHLPPDVGSAEIKLGATSILHDMLLPTIDGCRVVLEHMPEDGGEPLLIADYLVFRFIDGRPMLVEKDE